MKITYFVNQYPHVSHTFIRREILELESQGFDIQRVSLRGWKSPIVDNRDKAELERTKFILRDGLKPLFHYFVKSLFRNPEGVWSALKMTFRMSKMSERNILYHLVYLLEACRLADLTIKHKSKHIHAHFGTNATEVALLAHLLTDIPYSFTVHGPEEFDKPLSLHLREKIHHATFVCAISSFCRSQLFRWSSHADWVKLEVVRCGLDSDFLQGRPLPINHKKMKQLLCIGRLCEQKGQLLLLQAFKSVIESGHHMKLVLAGDGDMRIDIDSFIKENSLQDFVDITGWVSSTQVKELLIDSDAMILPSFAEGLPVAIMESMSIGRPVLTSYIAGIPELITHKENGFLFPAGDVEAIKNSILEFIDLSEEELSNIALSAYGSVSERHNITIEARKLGMLIGESND
ncbi:glycosyltransferase [Vibrio alfacsensis]|uniref:glycosyltransferase n=1 Tax=Vibrio alfacsensis TaxID=1074311 RepID=UPI004069413A